MQEASPLGQSLWALSNIGKASEQHIKAPVSLCFGSEMLSKIVNDDAVFLMPFRSDVIDDIPTVAKPFGLLQRCDAIRAPSWGANLGSNLVLMRHHPRDSA